MRGTERAHWVVAVALVAVLLVAPACSAGDWGDQLPEVVGEPVVLPAPQTSGGEGLRTVLEVRRSIREYTGGVVTLQELSQLLWAGQGVTNASGYRTAPSAGALFPMELYVVAERVEGLEPGLYHYRIGEHSLGLVRSGSFGSELQEIAVGQDMVGAAALCLVVMGVVPRTEEKYGERAEQYVLLEGGAVVQNVLLEVTAAGLGAVFVGAFDDAEAQAFVGTDAMPIAIVPVGRTE